MTLVFGAVCEDGVVMVGDKRITTITGMKMPDDPKIHATLRHIFFGYSGSQDFFDIFLKYVTGDVVIKRDEVGNQYDDSNNIQKFGDAVKKIMSIREKNPPDIWILVGRQFPKAGRKSGLSIIDNLGNSTQVTARYHAIGSGKDRGKAILDGMWSTGKSLSTKQFANLRYYAIKKIEADEPEGAVGGEPTIVYLGHEASDDMAAPAADVAKFNVYFEAKQAENRK